MMQSENVIRIGIFEHISRKDILLPEGLVRNILITAISRNNCHLLISCAEIIINDALLVPAGRQA